MNITPLTDERFALFAADDREFLDKVFKDHPKIGQNFVDYLDISAGHGRKSKSIQDLKNLKRRVWVLRHVQDTESVYDHTQNMLGRAEVATPPELDLNRVRQMIGYHDVPEVIITDLTPHDPFYHNKAKLEELAMRVIMEGTPESATEIYLVKEYAEQKTPESHWVHDLDTLDAVAQALAYETNSRSLKGLFKEFSDYAVPRMKTEKGKAMEAELQSSAAFLNRKRPGTIAR